MAVTTAVTATMVAVMEVVMGVVLMVAGTADMEVALDTVLATAVPATRTTAGTAVMPMEEVGVRAVMAPAMAVIATDTVITVPVTATTTATAGINRTNHKSMSIITKKLVLIMFALALLIPASTFAYRMDYGDYGAYPYMRYGSSQNGYAHAYPFWGHYGYSSMVGMTAPSRTFYLYPYSPVMYNYSYPFVGAYSQPYLYGYYSYPYTTGGYPFGVVGGYLY